MAKIQRFQTQRNIALKMITNTQGKLMNQSIAEEETDSLKTDSSISDNEEEAKQEQSA